MCTENRRIRAGVILITTPQMLVAVLELVRNLKTYKNYREKACITNRDGVYYRQKKVRKN